MVSSEMLRQMIDTYKALSCYSCDHCLFNPVKTHRCCALLKGLALKLETLVLPADLV